MSDIVIRVEGLGKRYSLRHQVRQQGLRHVLQDAVTSLWKPRSPTPEATDAPAAREDFWALRDVSFEVKRGDVVGIIGRNGAGKSTLLKILSRITEPTTGSIEIEGRVASLLEVGTGFHPELTGRENVYLNGAILGMSRAEIRKKFDEIVAFAEVEKFLDTPVKHYSSGMYVRLAFAVAAHLEPEILIVDEVLAVGDADFQKKCLGKMQDVSTDEGRTVLFVSHNMDAVQRLCKDVIMFQKGELICMGQPREVIQRYLAHQTFLSDYQDLTTTKRPGNLRGGARFIGARLGKSALPGWRIPAGIPIEIIFTIEVFRPLGITEIGPSLFAMGTVEVVSSLTAHAREIQIDSPGIYEISCRYPNMVLVPGHYIIGTGLRSDRGMEDYVRGDLSINVISSEHSSQNRYDSFSGFVIPTLEVEFQKIE